MVLRPTVENIKNGTYTVARPFNVVLSANASDAAKDFITFIQSTEGQAVIEANGYIAVNEAAAAYEGKGITGKIVIAGSSSVSPVMEKLKEAYEKLNTEAALEIQTSDSTAGVTAAVDGVCDIGMASRALKESETEKGLEAVVIAMDGIAVIVNLDNAVEALTKENVMQIFTGEVATWDDVK